MFLGESLNVHTFNKKYVSLVRSRREKRYEMDQCDTTQLQQRTTLCGRKSSEHQPLFRYRPPKRCSPTTPAARLLCKTQPASSMGAFLCRRYGLLLLLNLNPALFFTAPKCVIETLTNEKKREHPPTLSPKRVEKEPPFCFDRIEENTFFFVETTTTTLLRSILFFYQRSETRQSAKEQMSFGSLRVIHLTAAVFAAGV